MRLVSYQPRGEEEAKNGSKIQTTKRATCKWPLPHSQQQKSGGAHNTTPHKPQPQRTNYKTVALNARIYITHIFWMHTQQQQQQQWIDVCKENISLTAQRCSHENESAERLLNYRNNKQKRKTRTNERKRNKKRKFNSLGLKSIITTTDSGY